MTRRAWRLVKARHARDALGGEGARRFGGRWNSPGAAVVYASENASLAVLEVLVHLDRRGALSAHQLIDLEFPASLIETLDRKTLPDHWTSTPTPAALRAIGDQWLREQRSAVLEVPSVLVNIDRNLLLNPNHPDFTQVRIGKFMPFRFDRRLVSIPEPGKRTPKAKS